MVYRPRVGAVHVLRVPLVVVSVVTDGCRGSPTAPATSHTTSGAQVCSLRSELRTQPRAHRCIGVLYKSLYQNRDVSPVSVYVYPDTADSHCPAPLVARYTVYIRYIGYITMYRYSDTSYTLYIPIHPTSDLQTVVASGF